MLRKNRATPTINDSKQCDFLALLGEDVPHLVEVPAAPVKEAGAYDFDQRVRDGLNRLIDASPFNRDQIAELLSGMVGRPISKAMLDTYTGASRPNKLPAELIPALSALLGPALLTMLGEAAGCAVLERQEAAFARLGQLHFIALQVKGEQERTIATMPIFQGRIAQ